MFICGMEEEEEGREEEAKEEKKGCIENEWTEHSTHWPWANPID